LYGDINLEKRDDFQASFYGPLFESETEEEEVHTQVLEKSLKKKKMDYRYFYVKETHADENEFKFQTDETSNMFRYYIFTNMDKNKRISLHTAAGYGDKYFCTFMILEAEDLKFADDIIDKKGAQGLSPLYLLCEKGYRPNKDVNEEEEAFNEGRQKANEAEEAIEEGDGMDEN
jgi:hypothetical protein